MSGKEKKPTTGDIIRKYRNKCGFTQEELAEKIGVEPQSIHNWEYDKNKIDNEHLKALSVVLDVSADILLGIKTDPEDFKWEFHERFFNEDHMRKFLKGCLKASGFTQSQKVLVFADNAHKTSPMRATRYLADGIPYISHPFTLVCHAYALGIATDDLVSALLLHDVCEDCDVRPEELDVSDECREVVELVTKIRYVPSGDGFIKERKDEGEYYAKIRSNETASLVKCIDRCNNVSMMALGFSKSKINEYVEETEQYIYPLLDVVKAVPKWNDAYWLLAYQMFSHIESAKNYLTDFV